jgi:DNA-binding transcriptional ArsR family regulator
MSPPTHNPHTRALRRSAPVFAALGDETRLALVARLSVGDTLSISRLTEGAPVTRQAITKHLRVLEHAGVVRASRRGRERVYELRPNALADARLSLESIAAQWDDALQRLRAHVETDAVTHR